MRLLATISFILFFTSVSFAGSKGYKRDKLNCGKNLSAIAPTVLKDLISAKLGRIINNKIQDSDAETLALTTKFSHGMIESREVLAQFMELQSLNKTAADYKDRVDALQFEIYNSQWDNVLKYASEPVKLSVWNFLDPQFLRRQKSFYLEDLKTLLSSDE